ncbi:MAG: immunoglobulin-like domain-containing protein [Candidatus Heteroscillospira sp.]
MKILRKYWFPLILLCAGLLLICTLPRLSPNTQQPPEGARVPSVGLPAMNLVLPPPGLSCEAEQASCAPDSERIHAVICNGTGEALGYGEAYELQVSVNGVWFTLIPAPADVDYAFNDMLMLCQSGADARKECWLLPYGDWLPPGRYRVVFDILTTDSSDRYSLAAEFDVEV